MREKQMETKNIFSKKVATELRNRGFKILETKPSIHNPKYDMYIFEITPEFQKAIDEIMG